MNYGIGFPRGRGSNDDKNGFQMPSPRPQYEGGNPQANSNFNHDKYRGDQGRGTSSHFLGGTGLSEKNEDSYNLTFQRQQRSTNNPLGLHKQTFSPYKRESISRLQNTSQTPMGAQGNISH